jgi:serine protease Do
LSFNLPSNTVVGSSVIIYETKVAQGTTQEPAAETQGAPKAQGRGWLGVRIQTVTQDIADGLGLNVAAGVLVESVLPEGPACRAGLRRGDVILKADGVDVREAQAFAQVIGQKAAGESASLVLLRRGAQQSLTVIPELNPRLVVSTVPDLPAHLDDIDLNSLLGISVELLSDEARAGHGIAEYVSGVVITQVQPTQKFLKARYVVAEVDQVAVTTSEQLLRRVNAVRRAGRRSVLLTIATPQGETRYFAVPFGKPAPPAGQKQRKPGDGDALEALPELERLDMLR